MIRILHLADLHLGHTPRGLGSRAAERQRERDSLLARAVDHAIEAQVHLLLIAGDLFDGHRPGASLADSVLGDLRRATSAGITVVTVPGNHDEITYADSVHRRRAAQWPGVLVTESVPAFVTRLTVEGTTCHVASMAYMGGVAERLDELPRPTRGGVHVAVLHGSLEPAQGERTLAISPEAIERSGYDYVALGHHHEHRVITMGRTVAAYPGPVEGRDPSDPGVGFLTFVDVEPGAAHAVTIRRQGLPVRPMRAHTVDCGRFCSADELVEALGRLEDPDAIVRIVLEGAPGFGLDSGDLQERMGPRFWHLTLEDRTEAVGPGRIGAMAAEATVRGQFVRRMRDRIGRLSGRDREAAERALHVGLAALVGGERR